MLGSVKVLRVCACHAELEAEVLRQARSYQEQQAAGLTSDALSTCWSRVACQFRFVLSPTPLLLRLHILLLSSSSSILVVHLHSSSPVFFF